MKNILSKLAYISSFLKEIDEISPLHAHRMALKYKGMPNDKLVEDIKTLSSGTIANLIGISDSAVIDHFVDTFVDYTDNHEIIFKNWQDAFKTMMHEYKVPIKNGKVVNSDDVVRKVLELRLAASKDSDVMLALKDNRLDVAVEILNKVYDNSGVYPVERILKKVWNNPAVKHLYNNFVSRLDPELSAIARDMEA